MLLFTFLFTLLGTCHSHMFMSKPPSRYNKYSDYYVSNYLVNYNLNSPLNVNPDYFTFPCKGFPVGPPTSTFYNNQISVTLEGTAIHGGGHCQFGVSYDNQNFVVLKTVMYTCFLDTLTYRFELPSTAPDGNMILFWTWINRIGNREYYMECADIQVKSNNNTTGSISGKELLIVNLPGYPFVDEWNPGDPSSNTGEDLLLQRNNIIIQVKQPQDQQPQDQQPEVQQPPPEPPVQILQVPPPQVQQPERVQLLNEYCRCNSYVCGKDGNGNSIIMQCSNDKYVQIGNPCNCKLISNIPYCV